MINNCLENILVLDLSQYIPGPFATRTLGDMGADVIKIEPPFGDPMRTAFMVDEDGVSPLYKQLNAGKKNVQIDLKSAEGKEQLSQLVKKCDVLLESFRPGVMSRLGFDQDTLRKLNPKLIHCALSGYGQTGPYAQTAGHDMTYVALTGALSQTGHLKEGPVPINPPLADHSGAMQAVSSILAALFRRERTGKGAFIDVSLFEAALSWNYINLTAAEMGQRYECGQSEISGGGAAYYAIYKTRDDRYLALAPIEAKFWMNFCKSVGREDWIERQQEPQPQTGLISDVQNLIKTKDLKEWEDILLGAECCMEPIHRPEEILNHPHVVAREIAFSKEIRYPAWVDGQAPAARDGFKEVQVDELLS